MINKIICLHCGKEFINKDSHAKRVHKYCSSKCSILSQAKKVECKCQICGKSFKRKPVEVKKGFNKYCSKRCFYDSCKVRFAGKNNPFYGKKHKKKIIDKLRKINTDKHPSVKTLEKMREAMSGSKHPNYGKHHSELTRKKIGTANSGERSGRWKGGEVERKCEVCEKLFLVLHSGAEKRKFCSVKCRGISQMGEKSHCWKGGISPIKKLIRESAKYKQWRQEVVIRDDFTCQKCKVKGGKLNAHHKNKTFSQLLQEVRDNLPLFDLYDGAMIYTPLWDINNGITLCKKCHDEKHGWRSKK